MSVYPKFVIPVKRDTNEFQDNLKNVMEKISTTAFVNFEKLFELNSLGEREVKKRNTKKIAFEFQNKTYFWALKTVKNPDFSEKNRYLFIYRNKKDKEPICMIKLYFSSKTNFKKDFPKTYDDLKQWRNGGDSFKYFKSLENFSKYAEWNDLFERWLRIIADPWNDNFEYCKKMAKYSYREAQKSWNSFQEYYEFLKIEENFEKTAEKTAEKTNLTPPDM